MCVYNYYIEAQADCLFPIAGEGNFGEKNVTQFAEEYIVASRQNLSAFIPPRVVFAFFDGITESIAGGRGWFMWVWHLAWAFFCSGVAGDVCLCGWTSSSRRQFGGGPFST